MYEDGSWWMTQQSTNPLEDVSEKAVFLTDQVYGNFSLSSLIHISLEGDVTPDIEHFIRKNKDYLEKNNTFHLTKAKADL